MTRRSPLMGIATGALVLAAVIAGLVFAGSPSEARRRRLDERRAADLRQIGQAIDVYWARTRRLPAAPADLTRPGLQVALTDPVTHEPYGYDVLGPQAYRLVRDRSSRPRIGSATCRSGRTARAASASTSRSRRRVGDGVSRIACVRPLT